ncbi:hypothetical protein PHAVU_001G219600 [Phaseolus vulgaris]|uniref:DNA-directed RNA polymerase III subunit RPC9 n=1 Tax=Phaseolus vulgaris TaxID=3885 RepID=V7D233_PHAVU|nr:hypothetical protein PHAVU_001G219600g [Phaseolus vulgaris]ESW35256.1 hypothetical protein PHAVU_001G219600g [Phaseolus vulgaris]
MKILEANAGALTNFEVLDFLRAKGASKDPTRVIAKVAQSEYKFIEYCEGRFPDEEVTKIVELVTKTLPPPPNMKQKEMKKGDEESNGHKIMQLIVV